MLVGGTQSLTSATGCKYERYIIHRSCIKTKMMQIGSALCAYPKQISGDPPTLFIQRPITWSNLFSKIVHKLIFINYRDTQPELRPISVWVSPPLKYTSLSLHPLSVTVGVDDSPTTLSDPLHRDTAFGTYMPARAIKAKSCFVPRATLVFNSH